jgi:thiol-disulfide isomerase/thioredoxin
VAECHPAGPVAASGWVGVKPASPMACHPLIPFAALAVLAGAACQRPPPPLDGDARAFGVERAPGEAAPAADLVALDGSRVSLASLRGQVVAVNFWATWCPPCRDEMPSMMALARDLEGRYPGKFKMVAVSVDDGWQPVKAFFSAPPYGGSTAGLTVVLDGPEQPTTVAYYCAARGGCPGEYKLPETYVVDQGGRLVAYMVGPRDWSDPRARTFFEQLLR